MSKRNRLNLNGVSLYDCTYSCSARFKDGNIIHSDDVPAGGNSGVIYEIINLKKGDEGQYSCRAVSLGGKTFSRLANLVVKGKYD